MIAEWYNPYLFTLCIVLYIIIHVAYHYMGYHGRTWDLRKNNKKVKNLRILINDNQVNKIGSYGYAYGYEYGYYGYYEEDN